MSGWRGRQPSRAATGAVFRSVWKRVTAMVEPARLGAYVPHPGGNGPVDGISVIDVFHRHCRRPAPTNLAISGLALAP